MFGFFLSKNFGSKSPKKENKHIHPSVSIFVVMKEDRRAETDCLWLFKSKDGTTMGAVINILRTEDRPVAYRDVRKLDKKMYLEKWLSKSLLIHSGKINPKKLVFNKKDKPGKENIKTIIKEGQWSASCSMPVIRYVDINKKAKCGFWSACPEAACHYTGRL